MRGLGPEWAGGAIERKYYPQGDGIDYRFRSPAFAEGDEKQPSAWEYNWGHPVTGGHKSRDLALQDRVWPKADDLALWKKLLLRIPKKWKERDGLIEDKSGGIFLGRIWLKRAPLLMMMILWYFIFGFTEHLQFVTTNNHRAIANSHTIHFTTARAVSSQSAVFTSFLITVSNGGHSPYSRFPNCSRASATSF
jgi:hypothetical protein